MNSLEYLYNNKSITALEEFIKDYKLKEYEENLSTCSTYFRYEVEPNYFRVAHSKFLQIIAVIEITVRTQKFNDSMFELIDVFKNSVIGILESERVGREVK